MIDTALKRERKRATPLLRGSRFVHTLATIIVCYWRVVGVIQCVRMRKLCGSNTTYITIYYEDEEEQLENHHRI